MKLTAFFALLATLAWAASSVVALESNANRLRRGLPPLPPSRRHSRPGGPHRPRPSYTHGSHDPDDDGKHGKKDKDEHGEHDKDKTPRGKCNAGKMQCCNKVLRSNEPEAQALGSMLGIELARGDLVGITCSPISAVGSRSGSSCSKQPVCCQNNSFNGLIAIGCTSVNVG